MNRNVCCVIVKVHESEYICGDDAKHSLKETKVDLVSGDDAGQAGVTLKELLMDPPAQRGCSLLLG